MSSYCDAARGDPWHGPYHDREYGFPIRGDDAGLAPSALPPPLAAWRPEPFRAPLWARGPHLQTVLGKYLRPELPLTFDREVWDTPDGDELVLDFVRPPDASPAADSDAPLVVVLHGLEGNTRRRYALGLYHQLHLRGLAAVGLNFRGCARPNRTPRAYHSGETGDLLFVLGNLADRFPGRPTAAVGFSLGGNVLLKALGELGDAAATRLTAAVAVSVPYDLAAGAARLEAPGIGYLYTKYFVDSLTGKVRAKRALMQPHVNVEAGLAARTIRAFDEAVTAPLHGFDDADHYYGACSSAAFVAKVRVPTLLVHATDDPFLPSDRVPLEAAHANPHVVTAVTDTGGHVGFIEGPPWAPRFWLERQAASFLAAAFGRPAPPPTVAERDLGGVE